MGDHIRIVQFFEQLPVETIQTIGAAPPLHCHQIRIEHLQCIRSAPKARRYRSIRRLIGFAEFRLITHDGRQIYFRHGEFPRHADRRHDATRPPCLSRRAAARPRLRRVLFQGREDILRRFSPGHDLRRRLDNDLRLTAILNHPATHGDVFVAVHSLRRRGESVKILATNQRCEIGSEIGVEIQEGILADVARQNDLAMYNRVAVVVVRSVFPIHDRHAVKHQLLGGGAILKPRQG